MKKLIIFLCVLIVVLMGIFGAQAYFAGNLNQRLFAQFKENLKQQPGILIEKSEFEKGFLNSKASFNFFILKNDFLNIKENDFKNVNFIVNIDFINSFLSSKRLKARLEIFDKDSKTFLQEGELLNLVLKQNIFSKPHVEIEFKDMNISHKLRNLTLNGLKISSQLNRAYKIENLDLSLSNFDLKDKNSLQANEIELKNLKFTNTYKTPFSLEEYLKDPYTTGLENDSDIEFEQIVLKSNLGDLKFNNFTSQSFVKNMNENNFLLEAKNNLASFIYTQNKEEMLKIDHIIFDIKAENISKKAYFDIKKFENELESINTQVLLDKFLIQNPQVNLNLAFSLKDNNISNKSFIKASLNRNYEADIYTTSDVLPSKIIPLLGIFGVDDYFIATDKGFESSYHIIKEGENVRIILNEQEINLNPAFNEQDDFSSDFNASNPNKNQ